MRKRAVGLAVSLPLIFSLACAASVQVLTDDRAHLHRYQTWDWIPVGAQTVDTADSNLDAGSAREIARIVEAEFKRLGFRRARIGADLRVGVVLSVRRQPVTVSETGAVEHLPSLHSFPSYDVQRTVTRTRIDERGRFGLFAIDSRRRKVVWKATLEDQFEGDFSPHLEHTVTSLLSHFPLAGLGGNGEKATPPLLRDSPVPALAEAMHEDPTIDSVAAEAGASPCSPSSTLSQSPGSKEPTHAVRADTATADSADTLSSALNEAIARAMQQCFAGRSTAEEFGT